MEGQAPSTGFAFVFSAGPSSQSGSTPSNALVPNQSLVSPHKGPKQVDMHDRPEFQTPFKALFNKEKFSDVTFVFPSSTSFTPFKLYAYRGILSVWSDYFNNMFQGGFKEGDERQIVLKDVDYNAFSNVIHFMYTGSVELNEDTVWPILELADMYHVALLKEACLTYVENTLDLDNALHILSFAEQHSFTKLTEVAADYVARRFDTFATNEELLGLSKEALTCVLEQDELVAKSEWTVLNVIWKWTARQARVPCVPLKAPPNPASLFQFGFQFNDPPPQAATPEKDKGKAPAAEEEAQGEDEASQDALEATPEKQEQHYDLLEDMLPLVRLAGFTVDELQHIESTPALANLPVVRDMLLTAWKCKAGYAPPQGAGPRKGQDDQILERETKRLRTGQNAAVFQFQPGPLPLAADRQHPQGLGGFTIGTTERHLVRATRRR